MTQDYIGTKQITAWEQDRDGQQGYAVKYADGYISWSPKDVFEVAYLPMGHVGHLPPHMQRVVGEKVQLMDKLDKLRAFFNKPAFSALAWVDQGLLLTQADVMAAYIRILQARIESFTASAKV